MDTSSLNRTIRETTEKYLSDIKNRQINDLTKIEDELLHATIKQVELHNAIADKGLKWSIPKCLTPMQIAQTLNTIFHIYKVQSASAV